MAIEVMRRVEKKYMITLDTYRNIMEELKGKIEQDGYYNYSILNIYFDTDDYELIRTSIEKPIYKEKVRLRSYGIPTLKDNVFLELKKKHKGIVGKRRIVLPLQDFYSYMDGYYFDKNNQIMKEIDYCFHRYQLKPKVFIGYDRYAYRGIENKEFRLTFDYNIRYRNYKLKLDDGDDGEHIIPPNTYIMEVKVIGALPLWFVEILNKLEIYPTSFSKYGTVYKDKIIKEMI